MVLLAVLMEMAARVVLRCVAYYLRVSPVRLFKLTLLRACRVLMPRLSPFSEEVTLTATVGAPRMGCFQLGGANHADILSEWLLYTGYWQPALTAYLRRALKPGDAFVDVGANTGYFTLLAAALVRRPRGARDGGSSDGDVVAVEACPLTYARLRSNLGLNPALSEAVRTVEAAASDAPGRTTLYQHRREPLYNTTVQGAGAGGVPASSDVWAVLQRSAAVRQDAAATAAVATLAAERGCWREVSVAKAPLDALLSESQLCRVRVVKIDVEGGEMAVLRGMERLLTGGGGGGGGAGGARPDLEIVVEISPRWLKLQSSSAAELLRFMRDRGFHAYAITEDYEVARCHDDAPGGGVRPRRVREGEEARLDAEGTQADVIFSRTDAEWL